MLGIRAVRKFIGIPKMFLVTGLGRTVTSIRRFRCGTRCGKAPVTLRSRERVRFGAGKGKAKPADCPDWRIQPSLPVAWSVSMSLTARLSGVDIPAVCPSSATAPLSQSTSKRLPRSVVYVTENIGMKKNLTQRRKGAKVRRRRVIARRRQNVTD